MKRRPISLLASQITPSLLKVEYDFTLLKCLENLPINITNIFDQIKRQLWPHAFVENEYLKLEETNSRSGLLFLLIKAVKLS